MAAWVIAGSGRLPKWAAGRLLLGLRAPARLGRAGQVRLFDGHDRREVLPIWPISWHILALFQGEDGRRGRRKALAYPSGTVFSCS
jgi:hypothetical protein